MTSLRRAPRLVLFAAVAAALGAAAAFSCGIYDGSLLLDAADSAPEAAVPVEASSEAGDPCAHVGPPGPPSTEDGSEDLDLVFAGTFIRFSVTGSPVVPRPPRGRDMDGLCTCPGPEACLPLSTQKHCDFDGGADNAAGALFASISILSPGAFSDDGLSGEVLVGNHDILLRLRGYNGGKNDKQVTAIVYLSNGLAGHVDGGTDHPHFDGTDVWTVDPGSLLGGSSVDAGASCEGNDQVCVPLFADIQAYVTNGVLVARLDFPIAFGTGASTIATRLAESTVSAELLRDADGGFHVDNAEVAGRWSTGSFLTSLSAIHDPFNLGQNLCGDSGTYQTAKTAVCAAADLAADPTQDGKGQPCGAISSSFGISAVQAHLGQIRGLPVDASACGAGYTDDCNK